MTPDQLALLDVIADMVLYVPEYPQIEICRPEGAWYTVRQAARQLGDVSTKLVYKLYAAGELDGVKVAGTVRIRKASVTAYLDAHSNKKPTPQPSPISTVAKVKPASRRRRRRRPDLHFVHLQPQT